MIRALLFDYGGTLDTCGVHWFKMLRDVWERASICPENQLARDAYVYAERKLSEPGVVDAEDDFRDLLIKKLRLELAYLREHGCPFPAGVSPETLSAHLADELDARVQRNLQTVRPMLRQFRKHYKILLVSNFYGNLPAVLARYGLNLLFDEVLESAAVGLRKPEPALWQLAVSATGCQPGECLVIGDSLKNDIIPAASLGCRTIWLNPELEKTPSESHISPDFMVCNYQELERVVASL